MKKTRVVVWTLIMLLQVVGCLADTPTEYFNYEEYNYGLDGIVITEYIGPEYLEDLVIPSRIEDKPVVVIGSQAFNNRKGIVGNLVIPDSVVRIGIGAFAGCTGFTGTLTVGENVEDIGNNAFNKCNGFDQLVLNDKLKRIGASAFSNCSGLKGDLIIPDSVTVINERAFEGCKGFTGQLILGENLKAIGVGAFNLCENLKGSVFFPQGILYIMDEAFTGCSGIQEIHIPNSIKYIGDAAFGWGNKADLKADSDLDWDRIKKKFAKEEEQYGSRKVNENGFEYVVSGEEVVIVGYQGSTDITEFIIPTEIEGKTVVRIGQRAFYDRNDISGKLILPEKLRIISESAFMMCTGFEGGLSIPDSVQIIESSAFQDCSGLDGELNLGNSIMYIGMNAFCACGGLRGTIVLPDSLVEIRTNAFRSCSFDTVLEKGRGPEYIEQRAFYLCYDMKGALENYSERYIGEAAFESRVTIQ